LIYHGVHFIVMACVNCMTRDINCHKTWFIPMINGWFRGKKMFSSVRLTHVFQTFIVYEWGKILFHCFFQGQWTIMEVSDFDIIHVIPCYSVLMWFCLNGDIYLVYSFCWSLSYYRNGIMFSSVEVLHECYIMENI
jgi:hypothetical protein